MKKNRFKLIIAVVLSLVTACSFAFNAVAATGSLSDILTGLLPQGTTVFGVDIGEMVSSIIGSAGVTTTVTEANTATPENENQLNIILDELGISSDFMQITDIVNYIRSGGTFEGWLNENYSDIVLPDGVTDMSATEIIAFMLTHYLSPTTETQTNDSDTSYQFKPGSTSTTVKQQQTTTSTAAKNDSTSSTEIAKEYTLGDVDNNGDINSADARLALRHAASLEIMSGVQILAADVNGDGKVTARDARSILRYAAKLSESF